MSGGKEPSPGKQSLIKDKGQEFAIELQPTANKGGASTACTDVLFGTENVDESKIPKKPQVVGADVNGSGDEFENKYEDQTKKKVVKKKKKKVAVAGGEDEEMQPMMAQQMPQMMQAPNGQWMMQAPNGQWMPMMNMNMQQQ